MSAITGRLQKASVSKLAVSGVLLAAGAALAGHGAFATFTSAATASGQSIATGTVTIGLGATGASTNRLNINASGIAPGDTMQRSVDLANSGTINLASVTLGLTATTSSLLDTDATYGLQTTVQSCPVSWTEAGTSPAFTYTCSGTATTVLASTSVSALKAAASTLPGLNSLTHGGTDHLLVTLTLPSAAGNTFQGLSSTLTYSFTATQRAATSG